MRSASNFSLALMSVSASLRVVGETDDFGVIKANYGRFGPYIQYGKKYVSLKEITPEEVTLKFVQRHRTCQSAH
jgi:topoisomerase IA-like protein